MRYAVTAVLTLALGVAGVSLHAQRQIQLLATVADPNGAEIASIQPTEVRVTENGAALTVLKVEPVDRTPKVQILIDNGIGIPSESIGDLRKGLRALVESIPEGVEVTLVTTAPQPRFLERATTDRQKLVAAVDRLAPDSGTGRFVESLAEATQRIERDKQQDARYVLLTLGTSSGDTTARERDVKQIQERVIKYRPTVHVVLFTGGGRSASAGVLQGDLGQAVAKMSGGRYEGINVANRLVTLLPELGAEMAKSLGKAARQFRITAERTASGEPGQLGLGVAGKLVSNVIVE